MARYALDDFIQSTQQVDRGQGKFELERDRLLELNLQGDFAWMKHGAMVAYLGDIKFEREGVFEKGLAKTFKKALTGEGAKLTKASGNGVVYLADAGKKVSLLELQGDSIVVNGPDILAFEPSLEWDIKFMKHITAIAAGGLFNVRLDGSGLLAITTHYDPITLMVTPNQPVVTDPNATVAWSGNLEPQLKTDLQFKSFLGRGSGESFQMRFEGQGFVVIQPYEEMPFQAAAQR